MYKEKKILAIIPARGGSKGLPGKNIKVLKGKPLLNWSIDVLRETKMIDRIFVSTDSNEIAEVAKNNGVEIPFFRNELISKDNSLVIDAVLETIKYFSDKGEKYDIILLIEPTSPLRTVEIVRNCIVELVESERGSIATYSELEVPFERIWNIVDDHVSPTVDEKRAFTSRQELTKVYKLNGLLYGIKLDALLSMKTPRIMTSDAIPYITPRDISTDIDDINDFRYIEFILSKDGK